MENREQRTNFTADEQSAFEPTQLDQGSDSLGQAPIGQVISGAESVASAQPSHLIARYWKVAAICLLGLLVLVTAILVKARSSAPSSSVSAGIFNVQKVSLGEFSTTKPEPSAEKTITVNGQLQVSNSLILTPTTPPVGGVKGQLYYDQASNLIAYYNGTEFVSVAGTGSGTTLIQNTSNNFTSNVTNATAGITTPGGTTNTLLKFTGAQTAGDSIAVDNGSFLQINGGINLVAQTAISNLTLWSNSTIPGSPNVVDVDGPVELGVKFQTDVSGTITGLRFYKGTTSTGPYVGSLWSSTGTLLAQATFTTSGTGWQSVSFPTAVSISPDTTYIASYHTQGGGYANDRKYFSASGVDSGPLHALVSGLDGGNGVYRYSGTPSFPNQSSDSQNYWVDIMFSGAVATTNSRIRINNTQLASGDLANDSNLAKRTSSQIFSGKNTFRAANDAADAFVIQASDTTPLFTADTAGNAVYIGPGGGTPVAPILVLGKKTSAGDPTGTEGAIYYNSLQQSFRCYRGGTWENCAQLEIDRSFSLYEEFLGGQNTSFATNNFGSLGWHAQAIGANGSLSFDPLLPTPTADRPGILALQTPAVANQGTTFLLGSGSGSILLARENIVKTAVSVGSTSQVLRVGLHAQTTASTQPVSGVWWEADPAANANWRYCYGNGTTAACTATTTPITADQWVRLELRVTATGAGTSAFVAGINGSFGGQSTITIDTTNRVSPALSCFTTVATAQNCYWDYYQLKGTTSAAR